MDRKRIEQPVFILNTMEVAAMASQGRVDALAVALPSRSGVFQRITLPAVDGMELAGMVRLQFEKSLPYPVEESALGWQVLSQTGSETTLLACAIPEPALHSLCAPLLQHGVPKRLTLWAMQVATQGPERGVACGLWREGEEVVFGIFENRRLGAVEILGDGDPLDALPRALIGAEMGGAPIHFEKVFLDPSLEALREPLARLLGVPFEAWTVPVAELPPGEAVDFVPTSWRARQRGIERARQFRRRMTAIVSIYSIILIAAFVLLGFWKRQITVLDGKIATLHPAVDGLIERQARWNGLSRAVDPRRFVVEVLFQAWLCLPTPDVRMTRLELTPSELLLEGEAPNARQAVAFAEALKARPALEGYRFESGPPVLLPNEHAQFRILGKQ